jgi:hypothetical protein
MDNETGSFHDDEGIEVRPLEAYQPIQESECRHEVDSMLIRDMPLREIIESINEKFKTGYTIRDIEEYRRKHYWVGKDTATRLVDVAKNINGAMGVQVALDRLEHHLSFKKTCDELDALDNRIAQLRELAALHPDDPSYDKRIKDYMSQAESTKSRVFRHQYDNVRKAILLTLGKKLCLTAVSIMVPFIPRDKRDEAIRRFQAAIEPLLEEKMEYSAPSNAEDGEVA